MFAWCFHQKIDHALQRCAARFSTPWIYIISNNNTDDVHIQRKVTTMFVRCNILLRGFALCSVTVKIELFGSFCLCIYDATLWKRYSVGSLVKLCSCYNKWIKVLSGFKRHDRMTQIFFTLGLPTFETLGLLVNASALFVRR
jgi:hypothetical protein